MKAKVHVSRPVPEAALDALRAFADVTVGPDRLATADESRQAVATADAFLSMLTDPVGDALLERGPRLRIVANCAVGYDNLDVAAGDRRGVWMTNTPNVLTEPTADLAFALLLAAARRVGESERFLREGSFQGWGPLLFLGAELNGRTLGILGMGRIGQAVARRAAGFGLKVVFTSRRPVEVAGARQVSFDELLSVSDFLSIHVPLRPETRHLLNAEAIARMKKGAVLVNTARGPIVDEASLAAALVSGHLGGAGIDVYEGEPKVHPALLAARNAVLLPHIGSATTQARTGMAQACVEDIRLVLSGHEPRNALNRVKPATRPFDTGPA